MEYKRCYDCKFWATVDSGYSNYTVTETTVHCLKKHFEPVEESYSWTYGGKNPENDHEFFRQAEKCDDFIKGESISLDVDGEVTIEDYKEDDELYQAAVEYGL
jgi:hypothetical protein